MDPRYAQRWYNKKINNTNTCNEFASIRGQGAFVSTKIQWMVLCPRNVRKWEITKIQHWVSKPNCVHKPWILCRKYILKKAAFSNQTTSTVYWSTRAIKIYMADIRIINSQLQSIIISQYLIIRVNTRHLVTNDNSRGAKREAQDSIYSGRCLALLQTRWYAN